MWSCFGVDVGYVIYFGGIVNSLVYVFPDVT